MNEILISAKVLTIKRINGKTKVFDLVQLYDEQFGVFDVFRNLEDKPLTIGQDVDVRLDVKNYSGKLRVFCEVL